MDHEVILLGDYDYKIRKKSWDWLDIYQEVCSQEGVRWLGQEDLITSWFFDEVLEIDWVSNGKTGLLINIDDKDRVTQFMYGVKDPFTTKELRRLIVKEVLLDCFSAQLVCERGVYKYYLDGLDTRSFFTNWVRRVKYSKGLEQNELSCGYMFCIDGNNRYMLLDNSMFVKLGFDSRVYYYQGIYDIIKNKIIFLAFDKFRYPSIATISIQDPKTKGLLENLFHGENKGWYYICCINGDLKNFMSVCELIQ